MYEIHYYIYQTCGCRNLYKNPTGPGHEPLEPRTHGPCLSRSVHGSVALSPCMSRASRVARAGDARELGCPCDQGVARTAPPPAALRALACGRLRHLPLRLRSALRPHAPPGRACVHGSVYPAGLRPPSRRPGAFLPTRVSSPQTRPSDERVVTTPPHQHHGLPGSTSISRARRCRALDANHSLSRSTWRISGGRSEYNGMPPRAPSAVQFAAAT